MKKSRIFLGLSLLAIAATGVAATNAGTKAFTYDVYIANVGCTQSTTDCNNSSLTDCPTTTIGSNTATFYASTNTTCVTRLKKN